MARYPQPGPASSKGSLHWIQTLVNQHPTVLDQGIGIGPICWKSPLAADGYAEYRDQEFLDRLGVTLPKRQLSDFWPSQGPQWDALGCGENGTVVLVEAKAHVAEILSPPSKAGSRSMAAIQAALGEAIVSLGAAWAPDWSRHFYQYANRVAHAWFLAEINSIPVRLAFVNVVGDRSVNGPDTRREWEAALVVLHEALGLRGKLPEYVVEVFIDVRTPVPVVV